MKRRVTRSGKGSRARRGKVPNSKRRTSAAVVRRNRSSDADLREQLDRSRRELKDALEQQTATSEVLRVISSSSGELEPVFQSMLENAVRICEAKFATLWRVEDGTARMASILHINPELAEFLRRGEHKPGPLHPMSRVIKFRQTLHIADFQTDPSYLERDPVAVVGVELGGIRTLVVVPMLKDGDLVGAIAVFRQEVRPFTDKQIELVQNFAAQAVIAIENARLLSELRQRTDDLTESLEQQTATSEVLQVISRSPGELKPVFEAMLDNAARICEAQFGTLFRYDGELVYRAANIGVPAELLEEQRKRGPFKPAPGSNFERALRTRDVVHTADAREAATVGAAARYGGARSMIVVPMLKEDRVIGSINIYRQEVRPFTNKQVELVQNFAAQAVIAIENARLLSELRERTDDLTESLEQQTATTEVLRIISSSPGDLQPVFQAILSNARKMCAAEFGVLHMAEADGFRSEAWDNVPPEYAEDKRRNPMIRHLPKSSALARVQATLAPVQIADVQAEPVYTDASTSENTSRLRFAYLTGVRSMLTTPMLKEGALVGAIVIYRKDVKPFTDKQIALVQNFAAQAVIAIENARLLSELRETLQQQTATADVLKVISRSTFDLQTVLDTLVSSAARLCRADRTAIRIAKDGLYHHASNYGFVAEVSERMMRDPIKPSDWTIVGRVLAAGKAVHIIDAQADPNERMAQMAITSQTRSFLGVPLLQEGVAVGVLLLQRSAVQPFSDKEIELATTFADQASIAIKNVRLFEEIQDKSRQLAEASQHKSQFLANMSHELRTPLNAILGYTELIADGIYGAPPEKMGAVLKRVESNGRHLLGLINAVLDLSKIEAGQFTLDLADYSLQNVTQTVYNAVESLALDKKLSFKIEVQSDLPPGHGDERRLTQVLLNLVGNAIKFTDTGEVVIKAGVSNGAFNVSVHDTGPGISPADQARLFQEFQQADNSNTRKKEGTGLGLAISKRIIEMHGGRIWVESQVGRGATFLVMLPVQAQAKIAAPSN